MQKCLSRFGAVCIAVPLYFHQEFATRYVLPGSHVGLNAGNSGLDTLDATWQSRQFLLVAPLLLIPLRPEQRQLGKLGIDTRFFQHQRIARRQGFHLRIRQRGQFNILCATHPGIPLHDLSDESRLCLKRLPDVGIERAFGYITVDAHTLVQVALANDAPLPLFHIRWPPWGIQMMQCRQPGLDVGPYPHLLRAAQKDADTPITRGLEKLFLGGIALVVVNEGDVLDWNTSLYQILTQRLIHAEPPVFHRSGQVAEHNLRPTEQFGFPPDTEYFLGTMVHLAILDLGE